MLFFSPFGKPGVRRMEAEHKRTEHVFFDPSLRGLGRRPIFFVSGDCVSWLMAQKMGSDWGQTQIFIACRRGSCGWESAFVTLGLGTYSGMARHRLDSETNFLSNTTEDISIETSFSLKGNNFLLWEGSWTNLTHSRPTALFFCCLRRIGRRWLFK